MAVGDLFDGYQRHPYFDEMFDSDGMPRPGWEMLAKALERTSIDTLRQRVKVFESGFRDRGITFAFGGQERTFPLDPLPRVIGADEWETVERGVAQRVRALEAFLADAYVGTADVVADGIIPNSVVRSSTQFVRKAWGVPYVNGVRIHVSGLDLIRDETGRFCVLEDNVRTPSGISYVLENRRAMARVLPELFSSYSILGVSDYPARLLNALRSSTPNSGSDPNVVVLTPGVYNSAYFEHSFLARQMGVYLVEARDLICRDNNVYMRTTSGELRVDVIYRRVDDEFLDQVQFRPDSVLGVPGLINAARSGRVTIANGVGNGVADDKLTYCYVPEIIKYYLGENPILPNIETFRMWEPDHLSYVLAHMDEMVIKPVDASGGKGVVLGPLSTKQELLNLRTLIRENPRGFVAQRLVHFSAAPTATESGIEPRHVDLRPFAINDAGSIWVAPGGLTRVALPRGSMVVNSSQGGGSKDTWVIERRKGIDFRGEAKRVAQPTTESFADHLGMNPLELRKAVQGGGIGAQ